MTETREKRQLTYTSSFERPIFCQPMSPKPNGKATGSIALFFMLPDQTSLCSLLPKMAEYLLLIACLLCCFPTKNFAMFLLMVLVLSPVRLLKLLLFIHSLLLVLVASQKKELGNREKRAWSQLGTSQNCLLIFSFCLPSLSLSGRKRVNSRYQYRFFLQCLPTRNIALVPPPFLL